MLARCRIFGLFFVVYCLFGLVGCKPPKFYECEGIVTHNGKPIGGLQITFNPDIIDSVRSPLGLSDQDGRFEMASGHRLGVPPGSYTVVVEDPVAADGRQTSTEKDYLYVIDRYSPSKSDFKYVADQHRRSFELKLDTKDYPPDAPVNQEAENGSSPTSAAAPKTP